MDNAQKAIMIGVALFITIAVISAVLLVAGIGTDMMSNSNQQLQGVSANVSAQLLADYDNVEMTGASVIASIKKFYDKPNFLLAVDHMGTGYGQRWYSTKQKQGNASLTASKDGIMHTSSYSTSETYSCVLLAPDATIADNSPNITGLSNFIGTTSRYKSYIIYLEGTDNATIMGLYFKKIS